MMEWDPQFVWDEVFRPSIRVNDDGTKEPLHVGRVETAVRLDLARLTDQGRLVGVEPSLVALAISLAYRVDEGDAVYSVARELRMVLTVLHSDSAALPGRNGKVTSPSDDDLSSPE